MLDHCVKFCRRVTDVSMSSSSWQRNFNKTLNSCIIPEEKVKTPSLRCKYMYMYIKLSFIVRANWKPCSFSYWKKKERKKKKKKKSIFSQFCSQVYRIFPRLFTMGGVWTFCSKIMRNFLLYNCETWLNTAIQVAWQTKTSIILVTILYAYLFAD